MAWSKVEGAQLRMVGVVAGAGGAAVGAGGVTPARQRLVMVEDQTPVDSHARNDLCRAVANCTNSRASGAGQSGGVDSIVVTLSRAGEQGGRDTRRSCGSGSHTSKTAVVDG